LWHCSLLDDAYISMQRNIVSKRLCAEFTLIRMAQKPDDSLKAIAARVAALEENAAGTAAILSPRSRESNEDKYQPVLQPADDIEAIKLKTLYKPAGYWIEVIKKFEKTDISNGSFLNSSKAYKTDKSGTLLIRLPNKLAVTILDRPSAKQKLLSIIQNFDVIDDLIFETESTDDKRNPIDEIDTEYDTGVK